MKDSELHVSISKGNAKMGAIPSLSLPPYLTCSAEAIKHCGKLCYAYKIAHLREATVMAAYKRNYELLKNEPEKFWREVNAALAGNRFFRLSVSGDIPTYEYLEKMVKLIRANKHCEVLCFTKQFDICNSYLEKHKLPRNFHLVYSAWRGMEMKNPFNLPEAHVFYKDGTTTAKDGAKFCSGNCYECAIANCNCWTLKKGEQVVFKQH